VSTITYPELDPVEAARRWWAWKRTAVVSFGHYLSDHVGDTPVLLYVVWEGAEGTPNCGTTNDHPGVVHPRRAPGPRTCYVLSTMKATNRCNNSTAKAKKCNPAKVSGKRS
jgi:hypothetical protein